MKHQVVRIKSHGQTLELKKFPLDTPDHVMDQYIDAAYAKYDKLGKDVMAYTKVESKMGPGEVTRITEALLDESNGHHAHMGGKLYADSGFLQSVSSLGHGYEVNHMGFGEFSVKTPLGEVEFNRMAGKDFPGQSGRSHNIYDTKGGTKAAEALIHAMQQKSLSTEVHGEAKVTSSGRITEALLAERSLSSLPSKVTPASNTGGAGCSSCGKRFSAGERYYFHDKEPVCQKCALRRLATETESVSEAVLTEYGDSSNFSNYVPLTAKRAGPADCKPGHTVKVGDKVGWNPRTKKVYCADCWHKWSMENMHARNSEMGWY